MKGIALFSLAVILTASITSCLSRPPVQSGTIPASSSTPTGRAGKPDWELKWEKVLAEAKKEGEIVLYTSIGPETRQLLSEAFHKRFGIKIETAAFGASADLVAKVRAEQNSGIYMADIFMTGGSTLITGLKPYGLLRSLEPLFILPEVLDPSAWKDGKIPFLDKEKLILPLAGTAQRGVNRNPQMISEEEITSVKDVLKPKYKGKIIMGDARKGGAGIGFLGQLAFYNWNLEETAAFMRDLLKQEVILTTNDQIAAEGVVRGKYPIGLAVSSERISNLVGLGAPILPVSVKEGLRISSGSGTISLPVRSPNPNATTVFVNWILSKEGMTALGKGIQQATFRTDMANEWVDPIFLPRPGEKVFYDSEEFITFRATTIRDLATEIFAGH